MQSAIDNLRERIRPINSPSNFEGAREQVVAAFGTFSEKELQLLNSNNFSITIDGNEPPELAEARRRYPDYVKVGIAKHKPSTHSINIHDTRHIHEIPNLPPLLKPLYSNYGFIAAHEAEHEVLESIINSRLPFEEEMQGRCSKALQVIKEKIPEQNKTIQSVICLNLIYTDRHILDGLNLDISVMPPEEQIAAFVGIFLNPLYYRRNYGNIPLDNGDDLPGYLFEMACNMRGLYAVFGKDEVAKVAGELVEYLDEISEQALAQGRLGGEAGEVRKKPPARDDL